jgi:hypothetical protein
VPKIGHSGKPLFPECCTRGREAFPSAKKRKTLWEARHSGKRCTRKRKVAFYGANGRDREEKFFPECLHLALGVVWTSLGPLPRWLPGPILGGSLGLLGLCHTTPNGVGRKDYGGGVFEKGSYTCPVLCRELLDVPDLYSLLKPICNPASRAI